ncbi:hypothetical protein FIBSPDRAFT_897059 [Athelia psychrophila]|uniref:Uncharacterized protein n=1 Tax=Athelia psychrophila TaxID=1759441 RepID=A0A166CPZ3_9AGAM|nr:hypothetical protein FIBSPDRAFT_897059 [Fibularhizoctonia sp. CBS 109695]
MAQKKYSVSTPPEVPATAIPPAPSTPQAPGRCSGSSEYSVSSGTLNAMRSTDLSSPVKGSEMLSSDEPPPSDKPEEQLAARTRLRSTVRTTPNASKSMKDAHQRRAQQTPEDAVSPSKSTFMDGNTVNTLIASAAALAAPFEINPFISPSTAAAPFESQEFMAPRSLSPYPLVPPNTAMTQFDSSQENSMAPSSPSFAGRQAETFAFADSDMAGTFGPSSQFNKDLWDDLALFSDGSSTNTIHDEQVQAQWPREPPGLPSGYMPPMPVYATKPQPRLQPHSIHPQRYLESQPFGFRTTPPHGYPYPVPNSHVKYPPMSPHIPYAGMPHTYPPSPHGQPLMKLIPPTPELEGKQEVTHGKPSRQLPVPPSPSVLSTLVPSAGSEDKASEVDIGSTGTLATPSIKEADTIDSNDTPSGNSEVDMFSPPSSVAGSPSSDRGAASGRWKDATVDAVHGVYRDVDATFQSFGEEHGVSFARTVKGYLKHHGLKLGGDNRWNTYTQMHRHPEYKKLELERIQLTVEDFDALSPVQQQQMRSKSWKAFQNSFSSSAELDYTLELFAEYAAIEEKGKGTTVGRRHKVFNALMRSLGKRAEVACLEHNFQFHIILTGSHVHTDQALSDIRMSDGMTGFTEEHFKAGPDKLKGHVISWAFQHTRKAIVKHHLGNDDLPQANPSGLLPAPKANMSSSSSSSLSLSLSSPAAALTGLPLNNDKDKVATQARQLMRELLVAAGCKLGGGAPWVKLPNTCAINCIVIDNWPHDCPYPEETKKDKGIESAGARGLRALVLQFANKEHPVMARKIDDPALQEACHLDHLLRQSVQTAVPLRLRSLRRETCTHRQELPGSCAQGASLE